MKNPSSGELLGLLEFGLTGGHGFLLQRACFPVKGKLPYLFVTLPDLFGNFPTCLSIHIFVRLHIGREVVFYRGGFRMVSAVVGKFWGIGLVPLPHRLGSGYCGKLFPSSSIFSNQVQ